MYNLHYKRLEKSLTNLRLFNSTNGDFYCTSGIDVFAFDGKRNENLSNNIILNDLILIETMKRM